jgi:Double-GTPase 2
VNLNYRITYPIAIALACALALGVVLFVIGLVQALVSDPDLIVPAVDQAEQVKANPIGPGQFKPDLAWPFYPFRQSRADLERTRTNVAKANGAVWRGPAGAFFSSLGWWLVFPIPVTVIVFLLAASLASWFCYLVYWLVTTVCTAVSLVLLVPAAAILHGAEHWRRRKLRVQAFCVRCFLVTPWPAYQCPTCQNLHHDVRAGRLGLLVRRCECGTHLPTMALRAAWRLTALCKRCQESLPQGAGAVRDVRVPIFGDTSAGKTRFLYASLNSLLLISRQAHIPVSFPDDDSRQLAEFGLDLIRSGRETAKTSTTAPVALTCRLGSGRRSELVHFFDAAGEHFRNALRQDGLRFLDEGQGLVYILDPFSVEAIQQQLSSHDAAAIRLAHAAAGDPELAYGEVALRLRDSGVPASAQRLAVVVSKADLLRSAGVTLPAGSDAIAQWLMDAGVHNLVMSARREFAEARFFAVASQDVTPASADDPGTPLRWLLTSHGVRLPADPATADAARSTGRVPREPAEAR